MDENRIDKMFREAAAGFGADAPSSVWDRVSTGLDKAARMRRIVWYRRVAAAAAVLMAFFIGYYFPGKPDKVVYVENANPISRVVNADTDDHGSQTDHLAKEQEETETKQKPKTETYSTTILAHRNHDQGTVQKPWTQIILASSHLEQDDQAIPGDMLVMSN